MRFPNILSAIRNWQYFIPGFKKIGYIGWLGFGNLGDEALFHVSKRIFSGNMLLPYKYTKRIKTFERIINKKVYDRVCLGGGTLINSGYLNELKEAQALGYRTFVFGTGVKDPIFWKTVDGWKSNLQEWVLYLNKCDFVGVRGPLSKDLLENFGCKNVTIIGDPVLSLAGGELKEKKCKRKLGINIGVSRARIWGSEDEVLSFSVKLTKELIAQGWDVTYFPVCSEDLPYIQEAVKRLGFSQDVIFKGFLSIEKTRNYLKNCDLFIGEKLHSVILAMSCYVPSIMLEYRPKCLDFMKSMGLERFNIRTNELTLESVLPLFEELYGNLKEHQNYIYEKVNHYKGIQYEARKVLHI